MFDVDHFKKVNDVYGHVKGDQVLTLIGETITNTIRTTDIAGRYGGEEFMVILPNVDIKNCYIVAEKIREEVRKIDCFEKKNQITISAGIAEFTQFFKEGDKKSIMIIASSLVEIADRNLYKAKSTGRNKTISILSPSQPH